MRARFARLEDVTYLNNASLGMPPAAVASAVADGHAWLGRDPLGAKHGLQGIIQDQVLPRLAAFMGASPGELYLSRNATEALHLQAMGLLLEEGDEVLITTQEHPAGSGPWRLRASRKEIRLREVFIPSPFGSPGEVVELVRAALTPRTRAIAFCHVTRGGHLYPVKELCSLARERGIASVVDGAQALGMLPVDLHDMGCDVYAASLHKWMLGPAGTGVGYVRGGSLHHLRSTFEPGIPERARAIGPRGTMDLPSRAALATSLEFLGQLGIEAIAGRNRYLSSYLKERLERIPGSRLVSGPTPETSAPGSTIFVVDGLDPIETVARLDEQRLYIDEHVRDGHPAFRISTHFYNTTEEIDRAVEALAALA